MQLKWPCSSLHKNQCIFESYSVICNHVFCILQVQFKKNYYYPSTPNTHERATFIYQIPLNHLGASKYHIVGPVLFVAAHRFHTLVFPSLHIHFCTRGIFFLSSLCGLVSTYLHALKTCLITNGVIKSTHTGS